MIGFAGLTHLGLVYSLGSAAKGFETAAFDPDAALVARIGRDEFPVSEPGLAEGWREHRPRLRATADVAALAACPLVFVSLDVPTDEAHRSDLGPLNRLIDRVVPVLAEGATLVLLNQVPPGFTRLIAARHRDLFAARKISLVYQVETLIFGRAVERALHPERYIIGLPEAEVPLSPTYERWLTAFGCPLVRMRYESAELAKTAINLFLVSTVSTTNLLAELCEGIGADWSEIVPALRLDKRIGPHAYLKPGLGISGGNLPRDLVTLRSLSREHGTEGALIDAWTADSDYRRDWVLRKVRGMEAGKPVLAIWGLAYIANTASVKNSAGAALVRALSGLEKRAYDPEVKALPEAGPGLLFASSALDALEGADILAVMTPWDEFARVAPSSIAARMRGRIVLDPLGVLDSSACRRASLDYRRIGQGLS